jgi:hypothetical protein
MQIPKETKDRIDKAVLWVEAQPPFTPSYPHVNGFAFDWRWVCITTFDPSTKKHSWIELLPHYETGWTTTGSNISANYSDTTGYIWTSFYIAPGTWTWIFPVPRKVYYSACMTPRVYRGQLTAQLSSTTQYLDGQYLTAIDGCGDPYPLNTGVRVYNVRNGYNQGGFAGQQGDEFHCSWDCVRGQWYFTDTPCAGGTSASSSSSSSSSSGG